MRYMGMLFVMTVMVVMAAGSTRGNTSPGPLTLGSSAGVSELSSLPAVNDESSGQRIFTAVQDSTVGRLLASASPDDKNGCKKGGNSLSSDGKPCPPDPPPPPPPPRSRRCPPDRDGDQDHHRHHRCGKGDDDTLP